MGDANTAHAHTHMYTQGRVFGSPFIHKLCPHSKADYRHSVTKPALLPASTCRGQFSGSVLTLRYIRYRDVCLFPIRHLIQCVSLHSTTIVMEAMIINHNFLYECSK